MTRAPIVIAATVGGVAAVLGFHAQAPSLSGASATASSDATTTSSAATSSSSPSAGSSVASASATKAATGNAISTQYGNAQVKVTVKNGKIIDVQAVQLQNRDPKSVEISSYAAPLLRQSALDKQSGNIDAVSGASYTSESYKQSLQSALDKVGFVAAA